MLLHVTRGRPGWAILVFAVTLSRKQHAWLLLPAAALWRNFGVRRTSAAVAGAAVIISTVRRPRPARFWNGAIWYNFHLAPGLDSRSLYAVLLHHGLAQGYALLIGAVATALVVDWWYLPHDAYGFVCGSSLIVTAFALVSKQTFFNEWELRRPTGAVVSGPHHRPTGSLPR